MCTLTWRLEPNGYQLFFNRDEQRSRQLAIPAAFDQALEAALPIDPQGGGTWIALAQTGASLCLLNNYQAQVLHTPENPISRGQIIVSLLKKLTSEPAITIEQLVAELPLQRFAPFVLCYFPGDLSETNGNVMQFDWDGENFTKSIAVSPMTSSGFNFPEVSAARYRTFEELSPTTTNDFIAYHASHLPEQSAYSVCMHREDACSVSFCHLAVDRTLNEYQQQFNYYQGSPCHSLTSPECQTKVSF